MMRQKGQKVRDQLIEAIPNENTRRNYQSLLRALDEHFGSFKGTESALQLIRFVRSEQVRGVSPQSLKQKVSILKSIVEAARKSGLRKDNPVEMSWSPKVQISKRPRCPNLGEITKLKSVLKDENGFMGARDRAIITLMYCEGLRVHEVSGLNHEDFQTNSATQTLRVCGKGGFVTSIDLYPQSKQAVGHYRKFIPSEYRTGPFFIPAFELGKRLDTRSIRKRCNQLFSKAGWRKGLSCHSLRHAMSVTLLENGVPITQVQRKLRHRFLSSSYSYYSDVKSLHNVEKLQNAHKFLGSM